MTGLLALIDDIATLLDDVAILTKLAAKKTAGVLGDDLALNAAQVTGVRAERELPVVWAVAKGSFINKLILVPLALAISAFIPILITPLLMLGGAYLCFEGAEKLAHKWFHPKEEGDHAEKAKRLSEENLDLVALEKQKIRGAIRTDFILSAEIVVIALGTVSSVAFSTQVMVVSAIALAMTVGVYGLVAGIVKIDDLGILLLKDESSAWKQSLGNGLLAFAPILMKILSVLGTVAMFLVGGGIIAHGLPFLHHLLHEIKHLTESAGGVVQGLSELLANGVIGVISGVIVLVGVSIVTKLLPKKETQQA